MGKRRGALVALPVSGSLARGDRRGAGISVRVRCFAVPGIWFGGALRGFLGRQQRAVSLGRFGALGEWAQGGGRDIAAPRTWVSMFVTCRPRALGLP